MSIGMRQGSGNDVPRIQTGPICVCSSRRKLPRLEDHLAGKCAAKVVLNGLAGLVLVQACSVQVSVDTRGDGTFCSAQSRALLFVLATIAKWRLANRQVHVALPPAEHEHSATVLPRGACTPLPIKPMGHEM